MMIHRLRYFFPMSDNQNIFVQTLLFFRTGKTFDELMGRNCILVLAAVEEWDGGRATNFIVLGEDLSDISSGHGEVGNVEEGKQTSLR